MRFFAPSGLLVFAAGCASSGRSKAADTGAGVTAPN